eukprot:UN04055
MGKWKADPNVIHYDKIQQTTTSMPETTTSMPETTTIMPTPNTTTVITNTTGSTTTTSGNFIKQKPHEMLQGFLYILF